MNLPKIGREFVTGSPAAKGESQSALAFLTRAIERWENEGGRVRRAGKEFTAEESFRPGRQLTVHP